ncbi:alpha/beta hydrolase [Mesobacillus zeae]|uniref:Alpha/beta hydrolase n=1 Tax=Mesobacillus zeae TaxID=1917180 RepID=A0A398BI36_9BACI|nr:alpha/beta hydrolase [Mesobacillus zeae]RID87370.1 alpha/beta hydrolase [Mesobacillus zeae]
MRRPLGYLLSFLVLIVSAGIYLTNLFMFIKKKDIQAVLKRETDAGHFRPEEFASLPKREVTVMSPFGYPLKAILAEPHVTDRYVVFCHGVTENKLSSVKYMNLFIERGFNALIYDHRRHGESGGKTTSYGFYEKQDLKAIIDWLKREKGEDILLGIHGESMGAATLLQYAGMVEDGADFYVADCPYSDFAEQLAYRVKEEAKLPPKTLLPLAGLFLRVRDRYSLRDVSPSAAMAHIKKPVLFIHSMKDDYILPAMTEELFRLKEGPKKLFLAEKGVHARSYSENPEAYEHALDEFLRELVFSEEPAAY